VLWGEAPPIAYTSSNGNRCVWEGDERKEMTLSCPTYLLPPPRILVVREVTGRQAGGGGGGGEVKSWPKKTHRDTLKDKEDNPFLLVCLGRWRAEEERCTSTKIVRARNQQKSCILGRELA
jgi:hypothetical protein